MSGKEQIKGDVKQLKDDVRQIKEDVKQLREHRKQKLKEESKDLMEKIADKVYPDDPSVIDDGCEGMRHWVKELLQERLSEEESESVSDAEVDELVLKYLPHAADIKQTVEMAADSIAEKFGK